MIQYPNDWVYYSLYGDSIDVFFYKIKYGEKTWPLFTFQIRTLDNENLDTLKNNYLEYIQITEDLTNLSVKKDSINGSLSYSIKYDSYIDSLDLTRTHEVFMFISNNQSITMYFSVQKELFSSYDKIKENFFYNTVIFSYDISNCNISKKGKFRYNYSYYNYVKRTKSSQVEYHEKWNATIESKIKWINDCEYYLIFKKTNKPDIFNFKKGDFFRVIIYETTCNSYKYIYINDNNEIKGINELIILE